VRFYIGYTFNNLRAKMTLAMLDLQFHNTFNRFSSNICDYLCDFIVTSESSALLCLPSNATVKSSGRHFHGISNSPLVGSQLVDCLSQVNLFQDPRICKCYWAIA
jgi:hypothetical protein